tara:strand:- start:479 stop:676 length:198 start_codon:yes stop_codon:yes gene_type:complete
MKTEQIKKGDVLIELKSNKPHQVYKIEWDGDNAILIHFAGRQHPIHFPKSGMKQGWEKLEPTPKP